MNGEPKLSRDHWVSLAPAPTSRGTLFCFHHAGGGATSFRNWPSLLGPAIQVGTVILPGRQTLFRQPPIDDFTLVVTRIWREIQALANRPYALFGHSLGAALAFEVACRLEQHGSRPPACLIVAGRGPFDPHEQQPGGSGEPASSSLPDAEFVDLLRRIGGTPPEILDNHEMTQLLLPVIRADFRLSESYRWDGRSRSACPILVLGGNDDTFAPPQELALWGDLTTGGTTLRLFEGGHFFISGIETEVCATIAAFVEQCISRQDYARI